MNIYFAQATPDFEEHLVHAALPTMPEEKLVRMKRCRVAQQRTCMALSEVLLAWSLFESRSLEARKGDRFEGEYGKPMLRIDGEVIEFNMSHSGSFVLVGIDENPVGVDIQQWGRGRESVARKIMPQDVYREWITSPNKEEAFYDFWTRTESVLKWRGVGIAGLGEVSHSLPINVDTEQIAVSRGYSAAVCGHLPKSYPGAVCAQEIGIEMLLSQIGRRQEAL